MNPLPQKILFVLPSLKTGGAERVIINLANNLIIPQKNLAIFDPDMEMRDALENGINLHVIGEKRVSFGLPRLWRLIWDIKPDAIVSTLTHMNFALLLLRPFIPRKCKIIVRETTPTAAVLSSHKSSPLIIKSLYNILYRIAHAIILPSQKIKEELQGIINIDGKKLFVLPNPVDVERINKQADEIPLKPYRLKKDGLFFVCAGRLHTAKGFDLLLDNIKSLPDTLEWSLTILGEGGERPLLEKIIQDQKLEDRVLLYGATNNPWAIMAKANLFLLPSRWEGMPNAALESLAVGTPVLAMNTAGGIVEIAAQAGEAVEIAPDIKAFVEKMSATKKIEDESIRLCLLPPPYHLKSVTDSLLEIMQS